MNFETEILREGLRGELNNIRDEVARVPVNNQVEAADDMLLRLVAERFELRDEIERLKRRIEALQTDNDLIGPMQHQINELYKNIDDERSHRATCANTVRALLSDLMVGLQDTATPPPPRL